MYNKGTKTGTTGAQTAIIFRTAATPEKRRFIMNSLGERIAYWRKNRGLTQEQLAEKCSVTAQAVSKWENDLTAPDISLIVPLAEIFGITCDELLGASRSEVRIIDPAMVNLNKTFLKVKVDSAEGDHVNVNLPVSIAEAVLKSGIIKEGEGSQMLKNLDFAQIVTLIKAGTVGKLVEVKSADGDIVEVWVE